MLRILLNLCLDADHKQGRFPKTLLEKDFEFILSRKGHTISFDLDFMLLPAKIDPVTKQRSRKEHALRAHSIGRVKIILLLSTKIVALHM